MSTKKRPLDRALDLFVFAPLGLAAEARQLLPQLAQKGRDIASFNAGNAKALGQMAVHQGRSEAARLRGEAVVRAGDVVGRVRAADPEPSPRPAPTPPAPSNGQTSSPAAVADAPAARELAIPDYESLSASQVVPRLAGLTADELEGVRAYEASHRGRKTILGKVNQLQKKA